MTTSDLQAAPPAPSPDLAARARRALEHVCARGDFALAPELYSAAFVDHVNDEDFRGMDGIRRSVENYLRVLDRLVIAVEDQVADGDRVVSRWTATGSNRGRAVSLKGITISRFGADGTIAEDWTVSDNLSLLRQLGLRRSVLVGLARLRAR
jgi:predicted ester cyclase